VSLLNFRPLYLAGLAIIVPQGYGSKIGTIQLLTRPTNVLNDLRYALRSYAKSPGFAFVAVLALALGIGANTAMFSALDAVLLRQLPYRDPGRLVMIWESNPLVGGFLAQRLPAAMRDVLEWKRQSQSLEDLGYFRHSEVNLTGQDKPEQVEGVYASTNFLDMLGVTPMLGRGFTASDASASKGEAAVISYSLFDRRFAKDRGVVGRTIRVDDVPYTIVGVLPAEFHLPAMWEGFDQKKPDVWVASSAAGMSDNLLDARINFVFARLKKGVTLEQFRSEMAAIDQRLIQLYPKLNTTFGVSVFPLFVEDVGAVMRRTIVVLQFAVGFVLLIACANVANLLLARAAGRQKEIAIRIALGAGKFRLIRQMLAESLLLSVAGAVGGIALAWGGIYAIRKLSPADSYHLHELSLDWTVLAFTLGAALLTGLIFGLAPSLQAARQDVNEWLGKGGRWGSTGVSGGLRHALVISEIALALVLLAGAGLMIRSMTSLLGMHPGFRTDHLLTAHVNLTSSRYKDEKQIKAFGDQLVDRVRALPGVKSAAIGEGFPMLDRLQATSFKVEGEPEPKAGTASLADITQVGDGYFETLRAPILRGRSFTRQDADASPHTVTVVNEALARRISPQGDAVGKVLVLGGGQARLTVVGIKADTHQMGLDTDVRPELFIPSRTLTTIALVVETAGDPLRLTGAIQSQVWAIDPDQPVADLKSMAQRMGEGLEQRRFNMMLFGTFAGLALLLASVGIYGVLAYSVSQRKQELGIRIALGASSGNVAGLVLRQGLLLAGIGVAIGMAAALALTRLMATLIFGVSATDPLTFSAVSALLVAIALIASYVPARRAMRVDPMQSLRTE
jgi:putative ABC transport system permease protein